MTQKFRQLHSSLIRLWKKNNPFSFPESQQLQLASELIPFGVWEYDLYSGFITWNNQLYDLFGVAKKDFDHTLSSFKEILHPDDHDHIEDIIQEAIHRPSHKQRFIFRIPMPDGSIRYIKGNIKLIRNNQREPIKLVGVCIDVTQQRITEKQLKQERDKAELYLDSVEAMIVVLDSNANIQLINQSGCKITAYHEEEVLGKNWYDIFSPEYHRSELKNAFNKIIEGEAVYLEYYEREIISKTGNTRWIAWRNTLLKDEDDHIIGVLATGNDITEKKRAEQQLRTQNEQLKKIAWMQSHEVRKPLANILGLLSLCEMKKIEESQQYIFQYLKQSSDELDQIIKNIIEKTKAIQA